MRVAMLLGETGARALVGTTVFTAERDGVDRVEVQEAVPADGGYRHLAGRGRLGVRVLDPMETQAYTDPAEAARASGPLIAEEEEAARTRLARAEARAERLRSARPAAARAADGPGVRLGLLDEAAARGLRAARVYRPSHAGVVEFVVGDAYERGDRSRWLIGMDRSDGPDRQFGRACIADPAGEEIYDSPGPAAAASLALIDAALAREDAEADAERARLAGLALASERVGALAAASPNG